MLASPSFAARTRRAVAGCVALLALAACSPDAPNVVAPPTAANLVAVGRQDDLGPARAAQAKHTNRLLADRDVLGTGVGRLTDGRPEVTVFARNASAAAKLPRDLDGIPVVVEVTGDITILPEKANASPRARPGGGGGGGTSPTSFFSRPVPIGVSTGRADECAAGTISARVKSGNALYALSNNHVFAKENRGHAGDLIYQPGRYDLACATDNSTYGLGTLADFKTIVLDDNTPNEVDVAIVNVTTGTLGTATPADGYGRPNSTTGSATLNMAVQKYGRTTGLTTGVVVGIDVTVRVQYTDGIGRFEHQVQIRGDKGSFSKAGDSGSLIVTRDSNATPVALLFAGGSTSTFANPIGAVLSKLGVSIDGK